MRLRLSYLLTVAAAALLFSGCAVQNAAVSEQAQSAAAAENADPTVAAAMRIIEKAPDSPTGYNALAVSYLKKVRETADFSYASLAANAVEKALAAAPGDATARKLKASIQLSFHQFDEAAATAEDLLTASPRDAYLYGVISDANMELGNYDKAVAAAQKMLDLRPETASFARAAQIRSLYGDHKGAVEMMMQAARSADPTDKEAQSWSLVQLGDEYWRQGNYAQAEKVYDEALTNFPGFYLAVAAKGKVRAAVGDLAAAEKYLVEAENRVPNVDVIILLATVYEQLGDQQKAEQQTKLLEAVEQKLGLAGDQKRLALFWADRDTRLDEALAIAEGEYGRRKDIYTTDVYAWTLYKKGRYAEAKRVIDEAMRLKTPDARIIYHAGMIDAALGDKAAARDKVKRALKLNPAFDLRQAAAARQFLQNGA